MSCALGAVVGQVSAVDLDSPPYDSFTYRLSQDDPDSMYFQIDGATGSLRTGAELDRERRRMYRMSVIAQSDTVRLCLKPRLHHGNMFPGNMCPGRATCIQIHVC